MIFIPYDMGSVQPNIFAQAKYPEVQAASGPDAYQGRQTFRISRAGAKKQNGPGFSSILAEEEDAILTRLQSA